MPSELGKMNWVKYLPPNQENVMNQEYSSTGSWRRTLGRALLLIGPVCAAAYFLAEYNLGSSGPALSETQTSAPARTLNRVNLNSTRAVVQDKRAAALEISGGVAWLNTSKPISLEDLRGRIVLLDFWTLCCINCMHVLPDLAKLEAKYPGILVVLGIHTPKFDNEKKTESISKAILRYNVKHPVVNDADQKIWRRYGIRAWPTLVLIDPEGNYYGQVSGEGGFKILDQHIDKLAKEYKAKKMLKETPIDFDLIQEKDHGPLNFPGKVLADAASKRLFIADSTNHRIVITDLAGKKIAVAGSGTEGFKDGSFAEARFSDPQGMALDGEILYVADRKNHSLRALDLKKMTVKRVAGTGTQGHERRDGGGGLATGLNSPWDLLLHDGKVFIAMAGHHQIWRYDIKNAYVEPYAGNGDENIVDGALASASFAQPSGLASDGKNLYVADAETSSIRSMLLNGTGGVRTIVGEDLFKFGDVNGVGDAVRLQHALGVAYRGGQLYIADTYNSKIKIIDPIKRSCKTFIGDGSTTTFFEPGGLSFAGNKLYVADTNNHRIQVVDMTNSRIETLALTGVEPPVRAKDDATPKK
jgi:thiol-disulfide isomerase/thioredoxin